MIEKVKKTMLAYDIFPKKSVLVALSGGADSVALLHIMHTLSEEYGFCVYASHVNHNLRGDDAKRDENFSKALCEKLGIECFVKSADIRSIAKEQGISEEMAGRYVRYDFFDELMKEYGIEFCATAHHKNDNAETIVMNFIRGSSIGGLCGIPHRRGQYIRPLLDVLRSEIEGYCKDNGLSYVTDATNNDNVYTRNKIRNILIPHIQSDFNPNFIGTVTSNAKIIKTDNDYLEAVADTEYKHLVKDGSVKLFELNALHKAISQRVIRKMIDNVSTVSDVSSSVIESVYELAKKGRTGTQCDIQKGVSARIEYDRLIIDTVCDECGDFLYTVKIGECVTVPELSCKIYVDFADKREKDGCEYFSLPCDVTSISITNRRSGDKFVPSGMTGTKSLKSFMIDKKIPRNKRDRIGIMRIGGEIAWIIGYRLDNRFKFNGHGIKVRIEKLEEVVG